MREAYKPETVAPLCDIPAATSRSILLLSALAGQYGTAGSGVSIYSGQHHFRIDISGFWYPDGKRPNVVPMQTP